MNKLFGTPHYELISRYGYRETLIQTYATRSAGVEALKLYKSFGADCYPGLTLRYCAL